MMCALRYYDEGSCHKVVCDCGYTVSVCGVLTLAVLIPHSQRGVRSVGRSFVEEIYI